MEDKELKKIKDFSYMAGFFDGEGTITVCCRTGNKIQIRVSISQCQLPALELFKSYFGGCLAKKKHTTKTGKPIYFYTTLARKSVALLEALTPYLLQRRAQAELALELANIHLNHGGKDKRAREKWKLAEKILSFNAKGNVRTSRVAMMCKSELCAA